MTTKEVAAAVLEWTRAELPALKSGVPYPGALSGEAPEVWASVQEVKTLPSDTEHFPFAALEQVWLKEWFIEISIFVEQGEGDTAAGETHELLEDFTDTLIGSALSDATLGNRVQMISPRIEADLTEPFGDRPDGIRGRELPLKVVVAELMEVPS